MDPLHLEMVGWVELIETFQMYDWPHFSILFGDQKNNGEETVLGTWGLDSHVAPFPNMDEISCCIKDLQYSKLWTRCGLPPLVWASYEFYSYPMHHLQDPLVLGETLPIVPEVLYPSCQQK